MPNADQKLGEATRRHRGLSATDRVPARDVGTERIRSTMQLEAKLRRSQVSLTGQEVTEPLTAI